MKLDETSSSEYLLLKKYLVIFFNWMSMDKKILLLTNHYWWMFYKKTLFQSYFTLNAMFTCLFYLIICEFTSNFIIIASYFFLCEPEGLNMT